MDRTLRIRMLLEAGDKATRPLRALAGGAGSAGRAFKETRERLKALERDAADVSAFRKLKSSVKDVEDRFAAAQAKVHQLAREMTATDNPTKKLAAAFDKAKREAGDLKTKLAAEELELEKVRQRMNAAGASAKGLVTHERDLREAIARTRVELDRQGSSLQRADARAKHFANARERFGKVQGAATGLAAGGFAALQTSRSIAMPLVGIAKEAMDVEDVMADVRKVVNFDDQAHSLQRIRDQVIALSTVMPMTAEGFGQIVAAAGRSGIAESALTDYLARHRGAQLSAAQADRVRSDALVTFAKDAAKMAVAFDMSAEDAGAMMATWRTAFNTGPEGVRRLGDQVNQLTNTFGGNVQAVNAMVTRIGPLGAVAGAASSEIAALAQMMAKLGIEEDVGATGIKNTLLALTRGASATDHMRAAFKSLGLDAETVARNMQKHAGRTLLDVFRRLSKMNAADRPGIMTRLFGRESIAAIAPLLTNLPQLEKNFALVADQQQYAGSMEREYAARSNTTSNSVQLAINNFKSLAIIIGTTVLPTITAVARRVGVAAEQVRAWATAHPALAKNLVIAAALLSALFAVLGVGALAIAGILAPFAALTFIAGAFNIAMLPLIGIVLAVLAVIAVLAAAAYIVYNNWGRIAGFFSALWAGMKATVVGWVAWFATLPSQFFQFGQNLISGLINGIGAMLGALKSKIVGVASSAASWFKEKLGIHSPSRVFAGFGDFMVQGLSQGIDRRRHEPIQRVDTLSRAMIRAVGVGTAAAAAPAAAAGGMPPSAPAAQHVSHYTFNISQQPAQDAKALAEEIRRQIEKLDREKQARNRSSLADRHDGGDL